jgi:hypothetical protein
MEVLTLLLRTLGMAVHVNILQTTYRNAYFLPPTLRMTGIVRIMLATKKNAYFFAANIEDDWPREDLAGHQ